MRTDLRIPGTFESQSLKGRNFHVPIGATLLYHSGPMFESRFAADEAGPMRRYIGDSRRIRADDEIVKLAYTVTLGFDNVVPGTLCIERHHDHYVR